MALDILIYIASLSYHYLDLCKTILVQDIKGIKIHKEEPLRNHLQMLLADTIIHMFSLEYTPSFEFQYYLVL
jgi:hypothetical protein